MKSIFVQIASYQDHELEPTIIDCIIKSSGKYKINFGVCLVYRDDNIKIPDISNLKIIKRKAPESLGVGMARYLANTLYDGEDYYLQIDSHTRFIKNWDQEIIECYEEYKKENLNPIITAYPARYWYEEDKLKLDQNMTITYINFKNDNPHLFQTKKFLHQIATANPNKNIFTKSVSGGSIFSSGNIHEITPNIKMHNWGEEMLYAVRLFTHGYDITLPKKQYLYHLYYDHNHVESNKRNLIGNDFPELSQQIFDQSMNEVERIFSNNIIGSQELGSDRTLQEYEIFAGISFKNNKIDDYCNQ